MAYVVPIVVASRSSDERLELICDQSLFWSVTVALNLLRRDIPLPTGEATSSIPGRLRGKNLVDSDHRRPAG